MGGGISNLQSQQSNLQLSLEEEELQLQLHSNKITQKVDPMIDLSSLRNSNIYNNEPVRFPDLNIFLNEDGSVPSCLLVLLPSSAPTSPTTPTSMKVINELELVSNNNNNNNQSPPTFQSHNTQSPSSKPFYSSKVVSEEFKSLLNGLLDVRIPYRLGNLSRYSEFENHPCFLKYDYFISQLIMVNSPFYYQCYVLSSRIHPMFDEDKKYTKINEVPLSDEPLSKTTEELLSTYYYQQAKSRRFEINSSSSLYTKNSKHLENTETSVSKYTQNSRRIRSHQ